MRFREAILSGGWASANGALMAISERDCFYPDGYDDGGDGTSTLCAFPDLQGRIAMPVEWSTLGEMVEPRETLR